MTFTKGAFYMLLGTLVIGVSLGANIINWIERERVRRQIERAIRELDKEEKA